MSMRKIVLVAALAMVLGACGSGSEAAGDGVATLEDGGLADGVVAAEDTNTEAEAVDREQALLEFAACMRDQGVDMADPTVDADGNIQMVGPGGGEGDGDSLDREAVRAAREACSEYLEGAQLGFAGGDLTELQDTMLEYAQCMRENGYDMPDPDFSNLGAGPQESEGDDGERRGGPFGAIDPEDPEFVNAQAACEEILAGFGPGGGGGLGRGQN